MEEQQEDTKSLTKVDLQCTVRELNNGIGQTLGVVTARVLLLP